MRAGWKKADFFLCEHARVIGTPEYLLVITTTQKCQTVRLIETVRLFILRATLRSYGKFNRVMWKFFQTVRLIETVRIIESTE